MRRFLALPLGGALLAISLAVPGIASAHEQRDVGPYHFAVGFLNEPSIVDQMNGIDLTVTTAADKKPVDGLDKTLKAEVIVGGNARSMPISLQARFGMPGKYAGYFIPTMAGSYIFHFSGTIDGQPIDQRFESGPGRFDDVQPLAPLQFPRKLDDPAAVQAQLADAQAAANQGRALGIAGVVVGLIGVAVGAAGFARRREGRAPTGTTSPSQA
ncbi:MAG TPA: hypothetical protein VK009_16680 [Chloroflexota bacterium]|nr:hypothetical protein [Chloroflexota bacterium]